VPLARLSDLEEMAETGRPAQNSAQGETHEEVAKVAARE
jgi:hypothetical protein